MFMRAEVVLLCDERVQNSFGRDTNFGSLPSPNSPSDGVRSSDVDILGIASTTT